MIPTHTGTADFLSVYALFFVTLLLPVNIFYIILNRFLAMVEDGRKEADPFHGSAPIQRESTLRSWLVKVRMKIMLEVKRFALDRRESVSYTHLDVYKRQQ